jgi:hypothetical protein
LGELLVTNAFDLTANPFFLLGVSLRTKKGEISEAHEEALVDQRATEVALSKAQQALMIPKSRLEAELAWLPATTPSIAKATVAKLVEGDFDSVWETLQTLKGLDSANLAADLCCRDSRGDGHVLELLEAYGEFDLKSVTAIIAENRAVSGFAKLDTDMLAPALDNLRRIHAKAAMESMKTHAHTGNAMLEVVQEYLDASDDNVRHLLDDIAKEYDSWSEPHLREIADNIRAQIAALRQDSTIAAAPVKIKELLAEWDEISQPMQVIEESKGRDEHRSRAISEELRDLCLWLANDENEYEQALVISKALLETFPELPSIAIKTAEDVSTLEDLAEQARDHKLLGPLTLFMTEVENDYDELGNELIRSGFGRKSLGWAEKLRKAFVQSLINTKGTEHADTPWMIVRSIGIRLNNDENIGRASLALMEGLVNFEGWTPSEKVAASLREDHNTILVNVLTDDLSRAQGPDAALPIITRLLLLDVGNQREFLVGLKNKIYANQAAARRKKIFWAIAAACVVGFIIYSSYDKPRSTYKPSYSSSTTTASTTTPTPTYTPSTPTVAATTGEITLHTVNGEQILGKKPKAGAGILHDAEEIAYCLFEGDVLDEIRDQANDNIVDQFNVRVDDYNARCADYSYYDYAMSKAKKAAEGESLNSIMKAHRLIKKWTGGSVGNAAIVLPGTKYDPTNYNGAVAIQTRLSVLGFYKSTIDGQWGAGSGAALRAWKKANGMPGKRYLGPAHRRLVDGGDQLMADNLITAKMAVEYWKLLRAFDRAIERLPEEHRSKTAAQAKFSAGRLDALLRESGLNLATFEGKPFEANLPVAAVNIDDFESDDGLMVESTVEPAIVDADMQVLAMGKVILKKGVEANVSGD